MDHDQTDAANLRCRRNPPSTNPERALAARQFAHDKLEGLGSAAIRLDHATKLFTTDNLCEANRFPFGNGPLITRRPMVSVGVRSRLVVVLDELTNQIVEVVFAEGDEMVETFGLDGLDESLDPCIQIG